MGFFIDWLIELICLAADVLTMIATGSMYIGFCLYINGMVKDMQIRVMSIDTNALSSSEHSTLSTWSAYVQEIDLHVEIIK